MTRLTLSVPLYEDYQIKQTNMKIKIFIEDEEGNNLFHFQGLLIDSAVEALYKFARKQKPLEEIDF